MRTAALSKIARAWDLRNSKFPRDFGYPTCAFMVEDSMREIAFAGEARSKNRYAWVYRARKFRARRNVRVIPDHFEQNGHYDPVLLIVTRWTHRFPDGASRRDFKSPGAFLFRNGIYVTCAIVTILRQ